MAQDRLYGFVWDSESIQVGRKATPESVPTAPLRQRCVALEIVVCLAVLSLIVFKMALVQFVVGISNRLRLPI